MQAASAELECDRLTCFATVAMTHGCENSNVFFGTRDLVLPPECVRNLSNTALSTKKLDLRLAQLTC